MKTFAAALSIASVFAFGAHAWAGPIEDVARIAGPRLQALQDGNVDAYVAAFADNAVLQSSFSAFRIEGKDAIRTYFTELFQLYPKRRVLVRQPTARAYNDDLVVQNAYVVLYVTDPKGQTHAYHVRSSLAWAKTAGAWQIVDQHISRLPATP